MNKTGLQLLISRLQQAKKFDHPVREFRLIETHISYVLLTGDFAYKFKKPLDLGFLDFSTLKKRKYFCAEELRLNRRLISDLYIDVVAITGTHAFPEINGSGRVIEYAVKMRQFPGESLLADRVDRDLISPVDMEMLGLLLAGFHQQIDIATPATEFGTPEVLLQPVLENFIQIEQFAGDLYASELKVLNSWVKNEHRRLFPQFEKRKQQGFIRECHGDLHLGNIVQMNTQPVPFDGIEFNKKLYWIDTVNDIAFLVMDLEYHNRTDLAYYFFNTWLEQTGDYEGVAVLNFYRVYRAMVRAKVRCIQDSQNDSGKKSQAALIDVEHYLHLALRYTCIQTPRLLICHGFSGSGKTTLAKRISAVLPAIHIRSDVERKRIAEMRPEEKSHSGIGQDLYCPEMSQKTYHRLQELTLMLLHAGFSVIVDAAFLQKQQRQVFQTLAGKNNFSFNILHCHSTVSNMRKRIKNRQIDGKDASEANVDVLELQLQHHEKLAENELASSITINTECELSDRGLLSLPGIKK